MSSPAPRLDAIAGAALISLAIVWGASFPLNEVLLPVLPVLSIVALRLLLGALVLWAVLLVTGGAPPFDRRTWVLFAILGLANNVIPFTLIVAGQIAITGSLAAILVATTPLFTAPLAAFVLPDERLTLTKTIGLVLGVAGVAVMLGPAAFGDTGALWGKLAILGVTMSYACAAVFARRFRLTGLNPTAIAAGQTTMAALVLVPIALVVDTPAPTLALSTTMWLAVLAYGALCTSIAYILYFTVMRRAGATNAALVTVLVPAVAVLIGVPLLGEALTTAQLSGMVLIAAGFAVLDGRLIGR